MIYKSEYYIELIRTKYLYIGGITNEEKDCFNSISSYINWDVS